MNGLVLVREARRRAPGLPALLLTGYADRHADVEEASRRESILLLRKPISGDELAVHVASLLATPQPAGLA
jgi:DNA-binding NtrC family response regulator